MVSPERAFALNYQPTAKLSMWEWAERNIVLSPRQPTAFPGPYRIGLTPYVKGVFDALQDPRTSTIVVKKGAQTGLTQTCYIALGYWAVNDPGPALLVYPSEDAARSYSESRVMPMFEDSPLLAAELPEDRDNWTKLQYRLKRMTVNWVGSQSPANLASRPVRFGIFDEPDKYPEATAKEAAPLDLALQRMKTFWNRKAILISTPTTTGGTISTYYDMGDCRRYFVPCWKCGAMQVIEWERVRWDEDARKAWYECAACNARWTDEQKRSAVSKGEWRATRTAKVDGMASFHLPSFYAPWVTWADLCGKFLRYSDKLLWNMDAIKRIGALHDFVNSELGEAWEQVTVKPRIEVISARAGVYARARYMTEIEVYKQVYVGKAMHRYLTTDVQQSHLVCLVREWVAGGDSGLVDHRIIVTWKEVEAWAEDHKVEKVGVDIGYAVRASEVKRYCGEFAAIPMLGNDKMRGMKWTKFDPLEGTARQGDGTAEYWMLQFNPNAIKDRLWSMIEGKGTAWRTYDLVDREYSVQMTSEQSIDGKWKLIKSHGQNHFWDCEVMQLVLARAYEMLPDYSIEVEQ